MSDWTKERWAKALRIINNSEYDYSDDFVSWLGKNPAIWQGFVNKAVTAWLGSHKSRFGAKAIIEILRWESFVSDRDITFKINNNYASDMARLVMDLKPEMKGYFRIRGSEHRSDAAK